MLRAVNDNTFAKPVRGYDREQLSLGAMQIDARLVGLRLIELARANQEAKALEELYDANIVFIKVIGSANDEPQIGRGIDAIYEKHPWWESVATVHDIDFEGRFAANGVDQFVVRYKMDVSMDAQRSQMSEMGGYTIAKGKIIREVYLDLASQ